jgi:hypothetical protein
VYFAYEYGKLDMIFHLKIMFRRWVFSLEGWNLSCSGVEPEPEPQEPKLFAYAEPEPECITVLVPEPDLEPDLT